MAFQAARMEGDQAESTHPAPAAAVAAVAADADFLSLRDGSPASPLHGDLGFAKVTVCRWRSSAVERLICNQRVGGSIPSASSSARREHRATSRGGSEAVKRNRL